MLHVSSAQLLNIAVTTRFPSLSETHLSFIFLFQIWVLQAGKHHQFISHHSVVDLQCHSQCGECHARQLTGVVLYKKCHHCPRSFHVPLEGNVEICSCEFRNCHLYCIVLLFTHSILWMFQVYLQWKEPVFHQVRSGSAWVDWSVINLLAIWVLCVMSQYCPRIKVGPVGLMPCSMQLAMPLFHIIPDVLASIALNNYFNVLQHF